MIIIMKLIRLPIVYFHHSCVGATAIDAISAGYRTILIDDCCRGVDLKDIEHTKETVISSNGIIAHSKEVCLRP